MVSRVVVAVKKKFIEIEIGLESGEVKRMMVNGRLPISNQLASFRWLWFRYRNEDSGRECTVFNHCARA